MICATLCHQNPEPSKVATNSEYPKTQKGCQNTGIHSPFADPWGATKKIGCISGVLTMPFVYFYGDHSSANIPSCHGSAHGKQN